MALAPLIWAQSRRLPATARGSSEAQLRADHCQEVMQAHRQEIEATKADLDKMRSYLAQMKANLLTVPTRNELESAAQQCAPAGCDGRSPGSNAKANGGDRTRGGLP